MSHFDRVLLDGRARSSCAEHILPWLTNTSLVFWHDFYAVRQHPVPVCIIWCEDNEGQRGLAGGQPEATCWGRLKAISRPVQGCQSHQCACAC